MRSLILILCLLSLTGCASSSSGVFGWWAARGERAAARAEARSAAADAELLGVVQRNVEEFMAAIRLAHASRPVAVASEAGAQAARHLTQLRGPLPPQVLGQIEARAAALTSEDPATRAAAEGELAALRSREANTARLAAGYRAQLEATRAHAAEIARDNAEWAGRYLKLQFAAWGAVAFSVLSTVAAIAWKIDFNGLRTGAGELIGRFRARYGTDDEDYKAIIHSLDWPSRPSVQSTVATVAEKAFLAALKETKPTA